MKKYLDYLEKDNVKILIFGLILGKIFEMVGVKFYMGIGILYCIWLILNMNLRNKIYFKKDIKIKYKDICK